jgi:hypothetical protein
MLICVECQKAHLKEIQGDAVPAPAKKRQKATAKTIDEDEEDV